MKFQYLVTIAIVLSVLVGCSRPTQFTSTANNGLGGVCTPEDIQNWLDASWVARNDLTIDNLSAYGNDGSLYMPYTTKRYFWADGTPLCNGNNLSACANSEYDQFSYFFDYAETDHTSAIAPGTPDYIAGYRTNVYLNRAPLVRQPYQNLRTQVTLANRWCQSQRDANNQPLYSAGLVDFDANPNLPETYSPAQHIQVRCVAIHAPLSNGCDTFANNPPVVKETFRYNEDYVPQCASINNNPNLTPLQKTQQCGTLLCGTRTYQAGYMVEFNSVSNAASAICFHDSNFYNGGF
jgi:hypothetical protein